MVIATHRPQLSGVTTAGKCRIGIVPGNIFQPGKVDIGGDPSGTELIELLKG